MQIRLPQATLRPWRMADAPALVIAANNRNVWLTLRDRMPHPYALPDAEAYIQRQLEHPEWIAFCVEVEGRAAGGIALHPQEDVNRITAELGYWLAETCWGKGIMTGAVRAIVQHAFEQGSLLRIEAFAYANIRGCLIRFSIRDFAMTNCAVVLREFLCLDSACFRCLTSADADTARDRSLR